jgi:hypothetical protein
VVVGVSRVPFPEFLRSRYPFAVSAVVGYTRAFRMVRRNSSLDVSWQSVLRTKTTSTSVTPTDRFFISNTHPQSAWLYTKEVFMLQMR